MAYPDTTDSFEVAKRFLSSLAGDGSFPLGADNPVAEVPPTPNGFAMQPLGTSFISPFYSIHATPQFIIYNNTRVLFCQTLENPTLLRPQLIEAAWLHLHIAILTAIDSGLFTPQALKECRIQPCIVGLKPQPDNVFPLAHLAMRYAQDLVFNNLPF